MRTIPWAQLLCSTGTARPLLRCTAAKHGTTNEPFYHKEPVMPMEAPVRAPEALLGGSNIGQGKRRDTERICLTAVPVV